MLRSLVNTHDFVVKGKDRVVGTVDFFLINDRNWMARYFVLNTGRWLSGRQLLLSPVAIEHIEWRNRTISVYLEKDKIEDAPELDLKEPVSRQKEAEYARHFMWPLYWRPPFAPPPGSSPVEKEGLDSPEPVEGSELRSSEELVGYRVQARDGVFGHVEDFIVDDEYWKIRYLVIGLGEWEPERKVLISPDWVNRIDWARRLFYIELNRATVEDSPEYDPREPVNRASEDKLYDYYGKPRYWNE